MKYITIGIILLLSLVILGLFWRVQNLQTQIPPKKVNTGVLNSFVNSFGDTVYYYRPTVYVRTQQETWDFLLRNREAMCLIKSSCDEIDECLTAYFRYSMCNQLFLDKDGDGVPCETMCYKSIPE